MVKFEKRLVSESIVNQRSYGRGNTTDYIVIHQTGNTSKGANAEMHARLQTNLNPRQASWHEQVDDVQSIQSFGDDVQCWAAGDGRGSGNTRGYHIEICINSDGDYKKSVENGAKRAATKLKEHGHGINHLKQHADFANKNCPAQIRAGKNGITWNDFVELVAGFMHVEPPKKKPAPKPTTPPKAQTGTYKGSSIVNYLNHMKQDSSFTARSKLARQYGITNYKGTESQNLRLLNLLRSSKPTKPNEKVSQMAQEVIDNKHGNGHENRRKSLGISASEYAKVRGEVNRRLLGNKPTKTVGQMATEVIDGKHGNGHANRKKSLGVSDSVYQQVRAEVNRRS